MLTTVSPVYLHVLQNTLLILLSIFFLPLNTFLVSLALIYNTISPSRHVLHRRQTLQSPGFKPRVILVTGVGMTKGLTLARLFHARGHRVIGADFQPEGAPVCGIVSCSIARFYRLNAPSATAGSARYIESLLSIITREDVDLWVSCSGVASAVEDGEAKEMIELQTKCRAIQFDIATTQTLHEKDIFIAHTAELGLTVPETHVVRSREEALTVLLPSIEKDDDDGIGKGQGTKRFILKPNGVDDVGRADMTLLPLSTPTLTTSHLSRLNISPRNPWILQQFIRGPEFCTHSLIIRGQVTAFVACPSAELLMHYVSLSPSSTLWGKMLGFTKTYAEKGGRDFTGHLSFDFLVDGNVLRANPNEVVLYPIECNPRAHTAVVLFEGVDALVDAYLSIFDHDEEERKEKKTKQEGEGDASGIRCEMRENEKIVIPIAPSSYYWLPHDLTERVLLPTLTFLGLPIFSTSTDDSRVSKSKSDPKFNLQILLQSLNTFLNHLLTWRDGTFLIWDPLPYWWLYHVYWPTRLLSRLYKIVASGGKEGKWSRMNVSTTKMFDC